MGLFGLFSKKENKEVKKSEYEMFDYENFKNTGKLLNEKQVDYMYELSQDGKIDFFLAILKQLPNTKCLDNFRLAFVESIEKFGIDTNKNDMLYFLMHFNPTNYKLLDYSQVPDIFKAMIENKKIDVRNPVWYNDTLYVDDRLEERIKFMAVVLNPDLQKQIYGYDFKITTIEDVIDENNKIKSTGFIEKTLDQNGGSI